MTPETDSRQFEKDMSRDAIIIAIISLVVIMILVILGIKIIMGS